MFSMKKKNNKQTTRCYCPCGNELVSNNKEVYDGEDSLVHYTCVCGKKTAWDFYTPAPRLIEVDGYSIDDVDLIEMFYKGREGNN